MLTLKHKNRDPAIRLDLFKEIVGLGGVSKHDKHLLQLIAIATEKVEEYTQRSITPKTWEYTHENHVLYLPRPVIQEIIEVKADDKVIDASEYKKGYTRDTVVILLDPKYMDSVNSVTYKAGYLNTDDIPDLLVNVIFDYSKALFHQGLGFDNTKDDMIEKVLNYTSYAPNIYMNERIRNHAEIENRFLTI